MNRLKILTLITISYLMVSMSYARENYDLSDSLSANKFCKDLTNKDLSKDDQQQMLKDNLNHENNASYLDFLYNDQILKFEDSFKLGQKLWSQKFSDVENKEDRLNLQVLSRMVKKEKDPQEFCYKSIVKKANIISVLRPDTLVKGHKNEECKKIEDKKQCSDNNFAIDINGNCIPFSNVNGAESPSFSQIGNYLLNKKPSFVSKCSVQNTCLCNDNFKDVRPSSIKKLKQKLRPTFKARQIQDDLLSMIAQLEKGTYANNINVLSDSSGKSKACLKKGETFVEAIKIRCSKLTEKEIERTLQRAFKKIGVKGKTVEKSLQKVYDKVNNYRNPSCPDMNLTKMEYDYYTYINSKTDPVVSMLEKMSKILFTDEDSVNEFHQVLRETDSHNVSDTSNVTRAINALLKVKSAFAGESEEQKALRLAKNKKVNARIIEINKLLNQSSDTNYILNSSNGDARAIGYKSSDDLKGRYIFSVFPYLNGSLRKSSFKSTFIANIFENAKKQNPLFDFMVTQPELMKKFPQHINNNLDGSLSQFIFNETTSSKQQKDKILTEECLTKLDNLSATFCEKLDMDNTNISPEALVEAIPEEILKSNLDVLGSYTCNEVNKFNASSDVAKTFSDYTKNTDTPTFFKHEKLGESVGFHQFGDKLCKSPQLLNDFRKWMDDAKLATKFKLKHLLDGDPSKSDIVNFASSNGINIEDVVGFSSNPDKYLKKTNNLSSVKSIVDANKNSNATVGRYRVRGTEDAKVMISSGIIKQIEDETKSGNYRDIYNSYAAETKIARTKELIAVSDGPKIVKTISAQQEDTVDSFIDQASSDSENELSSAERSVLAGVNPQSLENKKLLEENEKLKNELSSIEMINKLKTDLKESQSALKKLKDGSPTDVADVSGKVSNGQSNYSFSTADSGSSLNDVDESGSFGQIDEGITSGKASSVGTGIGRSFAINSGQGNTREISNVKSKSYGNSVLNLRALHISEIDFNNQELITKVKSFINEILVSDIAKLADTYEDGMLKIDLGDGKIVSVEASKVMDKSKIKLILDHKKSLLKKSNKQRKITSLEKKVAKQKSDLYTRLLQYSAQMNLSN